MENNDLIFAPETPTAEAAGACAAPWKVLLVDDDEQVHAITRLNLRQFEFRGRHLHILSALSGSAARHLLEKESGIALALIDVVMETEHSGLDLVRHIRDELGDRSIRLILRTGQSGQAPERAVVVDYEVDDYKTKTELTIDKLFTAVVAALRSYEYIVALEKLNTELEMRVAMRTAELEKIALLDPLTGAANRRHLQARVEAEVAEAQRRQTPLALITFDIDHFKRINDHYGHAAGDQILQNVVEVVRGELRPSDFLARTGGEEFVVLLPGSAMPEAMLIAERLRSTLAATPFIWQGGRLSVTASFGASAFDASQSNLDQALQRADAALYRAKHSGRNQVAQC